MAASPAMRDLLKLASRLAEGRTAVLIQGESGTGKDLLAHWLHHAGPRRDFPMIKVHCPSIPSELLESELFGHEAGAFTDAKHAKAGKIELAAGGTVFFDQVQDLTPNLQAKLLRVVEDCRFERLGGTKTIEVDVRFVAASSVDVRQAVSAGTFRQDPSPPQRRALTVPLRERRDDILPLAETFPRPRAPAQDDSRAGVRARDGGCPEGLRLARERAGAALGDRAGGPLLDGRGRGLRRAAASHPGAAGDVVVGARPTAVLEGDREGVHPLRAGPGGGPADPRGRHPRDQPQGAVGETPALWDPMTESFRCGRAAIHSRRGAR